MNPVVRKLPRWAISNNQQGTPHHGLQERMRPDPEFDCKPSERGTDGKCLANLFTGPSAKPLRFSNLSAARADREEPADPHADSRAHPLPLVRDVAGRRRALPKQFPDRRSVRAEVGRDFENPVRGYSTVESRTRTLSESLAGDALAAREHMSTPRRPDYDPTSSSGSPRAGGARLRGRVRARAAGTLHRTLDAPGQTARELAVLRLTSNADLTSQKYNGRSMFGFAVGVSKRTDARGYDKPPAPIASRSSINAGKDRFDLVRTASSLI